MLLNPEEGKEKERRRKDKKRKEDGATRRYSKVLSIHVFYSPLSYALLWNALLCYAMLCYAMLCYAMRCYAMRCYAMRFSLLINIRLHQRSRILSPGKRTSPVDLYTSDTALLPTPNPRTPHMRLVLIPRPSLLKPGSCLTIPHLGLLKGCASVFLFP